MRIRFSFRRALFLTVFLPAARLMAVDATTVFNEVMYHPAGAGDSEWIELYNEMAVNMDLAGWRITGGVNFTFPDSTTIPAGGYLVVAGNPAALQSAAGIGGVLGPWTGQLSNGSETITLKNRIGRVMDEFSYRDGRDFPVGADGGGVSLAKWKKNTSSAAASSWTFSGVVGGTPGGDNFPAQGIPGPLLRLSDFDAVWNYQGSGADLGSNWAQTTYTAGTGGWLAGPGVLAFAKNPGILPVGTVLPEPGRGVVTQYFQRSFSFTGDPAKTLLQLNTLLDDGAVVYLNGTEVARVGMPPGAVSSSTPATAFVENAVLAGPLALSSASLVSGDNVLSVELHQYPDTPVAEPPDAGGTVQLSGGLSLAQLGGNLNASQDLSLAANGGSSFAKDLLPGYSAHSIPHLNDGIYGNSNSWIGNSENSFCGISLGAAPVTVGSIAWSRDQTGVLQDRSEGIYTIQYTTAANPGAATPEAEWTTLGTVTYTASPLGFPVQQRHRYNFAPVRATGVRLICPGNGVGSGVCVDELELYQNAWTGSDAYSVSAAADFSLVRVGPEGPAGAVPANSALASSGAVAFGSSELHELSNGVYRYNIADVNDGFYGNNNAWVSAGGAGQYIGVRFAGPSSVGRVAWGRDNTGSLTDRSLGTYTLQYTAVAAPGTGTGETEDAATGWRTIGTVSILGSDATFSQAKRHEFAVSAGGLPILATGLRIKVSDPAICIDELEASAGPTRDMVFGAQLLARTLQPPPGDSSLVINETGGSGDTAWKLELRNNGSTPFALGGVVVAASNAPAGYTLPAGTLAPGALLVLDQTQLGFRPPQDGRVFLYSAGKAMMLDAATVKSTGRARDGGDFLVPSAPTFGAENSFSLTKDVVISEIMYHAPPLPAAVTGHPPVSNPEEWIELYNKGAAPVNLGGWKLDDGVSYTFPANTLLAAGGYLVVAMDAAALSAKWPEQAARILGNFSGSLSNDGERVALLDAAGNPAAEVNYLTGGAWPELADGGGSSLELRDPRADLSNGASWAAGAPLAGSGWQTVSYTMVAGQKFGQPALWNEFRFGMLDAGECLIDDVSVVRVSNSQQLIQGGDFETLASKWRLLGNHGQSAVETDPGDPANHVLHVSSSGAFSFNHNHIETTFKGTSLNTALVDGQSYTVSFRAKWLSGSNLLNSRAYYSRLAVTTPLNVPSRLGTPGAANSAGAANIGPALSGLAHTPVIPDVGAPVTVSVRANDPDGMGAMNLFYAINGGKTFTSLPMTAGEGGAYTAVIPGQVARTLVQFYVEAADAAAPPLLSDLPAAGPASRALYVVNDGVKTSLSASEFRVLMLPADRTSLLATLNRLSDARIGGTVIYQRNEVFYDIGVRLQGTAAGRIRDGDAYTGFDVGFQRDHLFRGVHDSVNIDRSGRSPTVGGRDEIYVKHMFHRAGLPCTYDDLIYFVAPTATYTGTAILQMAGYEGTFVDSQYGGAPGTVFNLDGTYEPSSNSVSGNVESLKNPVPLANQISSDFTNLGTDKEQYRGQLEPRAGRTYDDFAGLMGFCQTMALPTATLSTQLGARMDVDQWMRCAALYSLCGVDDCYMNGGFEHNFRLWVPQDGSGIQALPWDMDFVFAKPATSAPVMAGGNLLRFINANGAAKRLFYGHLQDICNTVFNSAYMTPWLTHYGKVVGQSMAGQASYITARRNYLMAAARLPAVVAFAVTTNGGADFTVDTSSTTLAGTGWINIRTFRRADTGETLPATWTTDKAWQLTLPLRTGVNPFTIQALDFQGAVIGEKSITITSTNVLPNPVDSLRITELMYHPAPPSGAGETAASSDAEDFEFIELRNIGNQPLDISGCKFTSGVDFTFAANTILAAGEYILVARNLAAFQARYGAAARVAGVYGPADALKNSGETVTLTDAAGTVIESFTYSDSAPWPKAADGQGESLVMIAPQSARDWNEATGWRASISAGGNPNGSDTAVFTGSPETDADHDGQSAFLEFALGTSDSLANPGTFSLTRDGDGLLYNFRRAANTDGVLYTVESSTDLLQWTPADARLMSAVPEGNLVNQTWRVAPLPPGGRFFLRLKVSPR